MIELLAIPQWQSPPCTLDEWSATLTGLGLEVRVVLDEDRDAWVEVPSLRTRGLAVLDGVHLEAIHFEVNATDPDRVIQHLTEAATQLGWEIHPDDDDDADDDDAD